MSKARSMGVRLREMLCGYWTAQAIHVAAQLDVATHLAAGALTAEELATRVGAHAPTLYRVLRALASVGLFAEDATGRFSLTELGEYLRDDVPHSQRAVALMMGNEHYRAWGELLHSVRTGECAFEHVYGQNIFTYMQSHAETAQIFDRAMVGIHGRETAVMLAAYDFSALGTLVDVGGGNGSLLIEAVRQNPRLRGVLFDQHDTIARAQANVVDSGVADRLQCVAGDFFRAVPSGGDAYLLRHIIHDWDEPRCQLILGNCRAAMNRDGRLLVIEAVIPPGNEPHWGKFLDLNMLVVPGGKERTEAEYRALLGSAGFELSRVVPTQGDVAVIEARPV